MESLSVIVPVHNAAATLADQIAQLLDVLPDLTTDFEVVVVDDASVDQTDEVASTLARQYPQIRFFRLSRRLGTAAAVREAVSIITADVIFIQEQYAQISPQNLNRMWEMRDDENLLTELVKQTTQPLHPELIERLLAWGMAIKSSSSKQSEQAHGPLPKPKFLDYTSSILVD